MKCYSIYCVCETNVSICNLCFPPVNIAKEEGELCDYVVLPVPYCKRTRFSLAST